MKYFFTGNRASTVFIPYGYNTVNDPLGDFIGLKGILGSIIYNKLNICMMPTLVQIQVIESKKRIKVDQYLRGGKKKITFREFIIPVMLIEFLNNILT